MNDDILQKVETPSYIFDLDALEERIRMLRRCFGSRIRIVYAMKANPFLVGPLISLVDGFEVCSPGEERIAHRAGVPAGMMVLSGVNKEEADVLGYVGRYGIEALYTVESRLQMERLQHAAKRLGSSLRVLLRLSDGNQFGMDEETVCELLEKRGSYPGIKVEGIQYFSGTQKKLGRILEELEMLDAFLERLEEPLCELEYGPGLPVSYFSGDRGPAEEELLERFSGKLSGLHFKGRITLEIGRFLTAPCGYYLTSVRDLKRTGSASYCIVDGGIHQLNYYGQMMGMKLPQIRVLPAAASGDSTGLEGIGTPEIAAPGTAAMAAGVSEKDFPGMRTPGMAALTDDTHWTVCGSLCTTADVLVRDFPADKLNLYDRLVFEKTGAYSMTEGISLFLSRDLPAVYLYQHDKLTKVRERIFTEEWNDGRISRYS